MTTRNTPPLEVKGRFELKSPFPSVGNRFLTVIAVRLFPDCETQGDDVYLDFYKPVTLTENDYQRDRSAGAAIVTLVDPEGEIIYVPDTYIASYPNMGSIEYAHVVLSISLGPVPSTLDITAVSEQIKALVEGTVGVTSRVIPHIAPTTDVVSPEQHEANEVARQAQITNRKTIDADNARLRLLLASKDETIASYKRILIEKGILPA